MTEKLDTTDELIAERRALDLTNLPYDMPDWMKAVLTWLETISSWSGRIICFAILPLGFSMVYEVIARKLGYPTLWAYDISRMTYGAMFMIGAAYALSRGVHIRADFLYRNFSVRQQALVDLTLYILLFFPSMILFSIVAFDYTVEAVQRGERLSDSSWMPYVAPVRLSMFIGAVLLVLQGIAETLKCVYAAQKGEWP